MFYTALLFESVPGDDLQQALKRLQRDAGRPKLLCRACANPITDPEQAFEMSGSHRHRFVNPAGYHFDIGCFRQATGCVTAGSASTAHSWFPGYGWRLGLCSRCHTHLGWRFENGDRFYGLIMAALRHSG